MGVKSTRQLTRQRASEKYVEMKLADQELYRTFALEALAMTDKELEDALETLNDARYSDGMGGFDNYLIVENPDPDCGEES